MKVPVRDEIIKQVYKMAISQKDSKDVRYLTLIGTKILLLDVNNKRISYDRYRLIDELVYFSYYNGLKPTYLINFFLPIVLANRSIDVVYEDIVDMAEAVTMLFSQTDKKYDYVLDVFCYEKILKKFIKEKSSGSYYDLGEQGQQLFSEIKEDLISFNPYKSDKKENINFQKHKISYLNAIHRIIDNFDKLLISGEQREEKIGITIFDVFLDAVSFSVADDKSVYRYKISGELNLFNLFIFIMNDSLNFSITVDDGSDVRFESNIVGFFSESKFNEDMSEYLLRMRRQEILKDRYRYSSNPEYLLELSKGQYCNDVLLGRVEVIDKKVSDGRTYVKVFTKSGPYIFRFSN